MTEFCIWIINVRYVDKCQTCQVLNCSYNFCTQKTQKLAEKLKHNAQCVAKTYRKSHIMSKSYDVLS